MGATYILVTTNDTQENLTFVNHEDLSERFTIAAGNEVGMDVAIPWCNNEDDFEKKNKWIELRFGRTGQEDVVLAVYQSWKSDGDHVRVSRGLEDGRYSDPGEKIGRVDRPGNRWKLTLASTEASPAPGDIQIKMLEIP